LSICPGMCANLVVLTCTYAHPRPKRNKFNQLLGSGGKPCRRVQSYCQRGAGEGGEEFRVHSQGWRISVVRSIGDVDVVPYPSPVILMNKLRHTNG
jgi:hypothetical protein